MSLWFNRIDLTPPTGYLAGPLSTIKIIEQDQAAKAVIGEFRPAAARLLEKAGDTDLDTFSE